MAPPAIEQSILRPKSVKVRPHPDSVILRDEAVGTATGSTAPGAAPRKRARNSLPISSTLYTAEHNLHLRGGISVGTSASVVLDAANLPQIPQIPHIGTGTCTGVDAGADSVGTHFDGQLLPLDTPGAIELIRTCTLTSVEEFGGIKPEDMFTQALCIKSQVRLGYLGGGSGSVGGSGSGGGKGSSDVDAVHGPVQPHHREKTVHWLLQLRQVLNLCSICLSRAVIILDKFIQDNPLRVHLLQLAACASLFIAVKCTNVHTLAVATLVDHARGAFDGTALLQMESVILNQMNFTVNVRGPPDVLFPVIDAEPHRVQLAAWFGIDAATADHRCSSMHPGEVAFGALVLGRLIDANSSKLSTLTPQVAEWARRVLQAWVTAARSQEGNFLTLVALKPYVAAFVFAPAARATIQRQLNVAVPIMDGFSKWAYDMHKRNPGPGTNAVAGRRLN